MKRKIFRLLFIALALSLTSCEETLSEIELDIINNDIPKSLYEDKVTEIADALDDYLFEGIDEYSDIVGDKVKNNIEESARLSSIWGHWDISVVFGGPTKEERLAKQYSNYIDYINRNRQNMYDLIMGIAGKIAENPRILKEFPGNSETIDLNVFSDIEYMPNSISRTDYDSYINKTFNKSDKLDWGKTIFPYSEKPKFSTPALVVATISILSKLPYPKPVYAVYDSQSESWEVGYSSEQAVELVFTWRGDVVEYEYQECTYSSAYISSEINVLKPNKKRKKL